VASLQFSLTTGDGKSWQFQYSLLNLLLFCALLGSVIGAAVLSFRGMVADQQRAQQQAMLGAMLKEREMWVAGVSRELNHLAEELGKILNGLPEGHTADKARELDLKVRAVVQEFSRAEVEKRKMASELEFTSQQLTNVAGQVESQRRAAAKVVEYLQKTLQELESGQKELSQRIEEVLNESRRMR